MENKTTVVMKRMECGQYEENQNNHHDHKGDWSIVDYIDCMAARFHVGIWQDANDSRLYHARSLESNDRFDSFYLWERTQYTTAKVTK